MELDLIYTVFGYKLKTRVSKFQFVSVCRSQPGQSAEVHSGSFDRWGRGTAPPALDLHWTCGNEKVRFKCPAPLSVTA